jgi:hypothetical protein
VEYEPPQVLGATTSGPEALDNLADKGYMQVGTAVESAGGKRSMYSSAGSKHRVCGCIGEPLNCSVICAAATARWCGRQSSIQATRCHLWWSQTARAAAVTALHMSAEAHAWHSKRKLVLLSQHAYYAVSERHWANLAINSCTAVEG